MNPEDEPLVVIVSNKPGKATGQLELISEAGVAAAVAAVKNALLQLGYRTAELLLSDTDNLITDIRRSGAETVFNLCEGLNGDSEMEMHVASLLRLAGIPFTGNNPLTLGIARNKPLTKRILRALGIAVPEDIFLTRIPEKLPDGLRFPLICKPAYEDASLGILSDAVVHSFPELRKLLPRLLEKYPDGVLAEEYVEGREFNVALFADGDEFYVLPPSEIDFSRLPAAAEHIVSYEAKWLEDSPAYQATPAVCPAPVSGALAGRLKAVALAVSRGVGGNSYGRIDIRLNRDEKIFVLEYNPNPDISPDAGFAKALAAAGIPYADFVKMTLREAAKRRAKELKP